MRRIAFLHPRERRLALMAAVVVGCWVLVSFAVQPLWEHVKELERAVRARAEKLTAIDRLLSQAPSPADHAQALGAYLERDESEDAPSTFLHELEALSQRAQVQLSLKPRPVKREERLRRLEVEVEAEGSQQHLLAFLDALIRMPRLITVERLRLSTVPTKTDLLRAHLTIHRLVLLPKNQPR